MIVTFCKTKSYNGFKIVVNGKWLYVSYKELDNVVCNKATSCQFREIKDEHSSSSEAQLEQHKA